jgi:hypothetical protein
MENNYNGLNMSLIGNKVLFSNKVTKIKDDQGNTILLGSLYENTNDPKNDKNLYRNQYKII